MKLLILAGGYGTRLYPIVKDIPKALLEVQGKPLITFTLEKFLHVKAIEEACIVTNDKFATMLQAWAKAQHRCPFPLRVVNDGTRTPEERLGAIGDLLFVLDKEKTPSDWIIVGSDNLFDGDMAPFVHFAASRSPAVTIGCYDIEDIQNASKYGIVELGGNGRMLSLEEKPEHPKSTLISMCLYYLPAASLKYISTYVKETQKTDTTGGYLQWLYKKTDVYGFKFEGKWYDIGSLESYEDAQKNFSV